MLVKNEKYNEIQHDLQTMSETLLKQCVLVGDLFATSWKDRNYEQFLINEENIDLLEEKMIHKASNIVIQFAPKGKDLRKIVSFHEVIMHIAVIGDYLKTIVDVIKEAEIHSSDYAEYKTVLTEYFRLSQKVIREACYSFYHEDINLACRIVELSQYEEMKKMKANTMDKIFLDYEMIPLEKIEIINITVFDKIFYFIEKMTEIAISISKCTIFVLGEAKGRNNL